MGRRTQQDDEGSLDSLLDTMTNVVGILVILMIVMQLGVADAVKRILRAGEAPAMEITPQALADAKRQREELERTIASLHQQWKGLEASKADEAAAIDDVKRLTDQLRAQLADAERGKVDADKLDAELAERTKRADELNKKQDAMESELAKLRAQLDATAVAEAPPAKIVTLPNPRQAPQGAKPITLIVKDGVVTPGDDDAMREVVEVAMKRLRITPNEQGLIDCQKLAQAFESAKLGDRYWIVRLKVVNFRPYIVPVRRDSAGESAEQLANPGSAYMRLVRLTKQQGNYLRFIVWSDSHDTYIEARRLADEHEVAAGWSATDSGQEWRIAIPGKVECLGKPPAPAPPPPPPPVKPDPNAPKPPPPPPPDPDAPKPKPPLPKEDID